jgi:acetylornithine deacetylase/succinyl-diaminopimelate desuccinylase-like protein
MNRIETAWNWLRERREEHLQDFREILAMPSVSTLPEHADDVKRMAQWLQGRLEKLGMHAVEIIPTEGHPIVYAEWLGAPDAPTVLVYGHYDVQPVDPLGEWDSDPFEGTIRGDYIHARGASDMKGQLLPHLKAVEALLDSGPLPVNLKYMLEGEEEIGSPNLPGFIDTHREKLACDFVLNCDGGIHGADAPSITYALRGLAYFELELRGPSHDLHSGLFGGTVANPIHALSALIAGMHDDQGRVTLPGFYDRVRSLEDDERAALKDVPHSDEEWKSLAGVDALTGESGYSTIERMGARPCLDVNGIWGGFTGEGAKTVLPARAHAKLSARLVPDQRPEEVEAQLRHYLEAEMPEGMAWSLHCHSWGPGAVMDRHAPAMQTTAAALEAVFGKKPFFERIGGSVPVVGMMQEKLGVDSVMLGFALPGDGIHGPNERQYLPNFFKGMEVHAHLLASLKST